jgi:hypothetical protein
MPAFFRPFSFIPTFVLALEFDACPRLLFTVFANMQFGTSKIGACRWIRLGASACPNGRLHSGLVKNVAQFTLVAEQIFRGPEKIKLKNYYSNFMLYLFYQYFYIFSFFFCFYHEIKYENKFYLNE